VASAVNGFAADRQLSGRVLEDEHDWLMDSFDEYEWRKLICDRNG
jgi:hypothetical protein